LKNRASEDSRTHLISSGGCDGFLVVTSADDPHTAEGCIVPSAYDNGTGWIGFFCVNEPYRGKGWGARLFSAALKHFEKTGTTFVGLDAVQEQVNTYARRGFVDKGRIRLMQRPSLKDLPLDQKSLELHGANLVPLSSVKKEVLVKSDLEKTGLERTRLWSDEALFSRPDTFGFALVSGDDVSNLKGWIMGRYCQHGYRFGPLYAIHAIVASTLLQAAMNELNGKPGSLIAEVWPGNPAAADVFTAAGWSEAGIEYHRMWLGGRVPQEQSPGGKADTEIFAIFDAGEG
jgi:Acetyltransferase (GNAT) domain